MKATLTNKGGEITKLELEEGTKLIDVIHDYINIVKVEVEGLTTNTIFVLENGAFKGSIVNRK